MSLVKAKSSVVRKFLIFQTFNLGLDKINIATNFF